MKEEVGVSRALPSPYYASARMARVRRKGAGAELNLRKKLHRKGLRYRVHRPILAKLRRMADAVF